MVFWEFFHLSIWAFGHLCMWAFGHLGIWAFANMGICHMAKWPIPQIPPKNCTQMPICPNEYRNAQITTSPKAKIIKCPKAFGHLSNHLDICSFGRLGIWAFIGTFDHLGIWACVFWACSPKGQTAQCLNVQISKGMPKCPNAHVSK